MNFTFVPKYVLDSEIFYWKYNAIEVLGVENEQPLLPHHLTLGREKEEMQVATEMDTKMSTL